MPMILFARIQLHWRRVRLRATVSHRLHLSRFNVYSSSGEQPKTPEDGGLTRVVVPYFSLCLFSLAKS